MKTTLIALIAAFALTQSVNREAGCGFKGDIGVNSPFFPSSKSAANTISRPHVTKPKAVSKRPVTKSKAKLTSHRIEAR